MANSFLNKLYSTTLLCTLGFTALQAETYDNTSFYIAYDKNDLTQYVLVMPSVNKVYTHVAGHILPEDLKRVDEAFINFPTYNDGTLCFPALADGADESNGAGLMADNCYEVNFFYTQKDTLSEGTAFMLYYAPEERVYEGLAGDATSFKVVKDGDTVYNDNSISGDDYSAFTFDIKTGIVENLEPTDIEILTQETKALLAGKSFYTIGEYSDGSATDYGIATFNDNADTLTWEDLDGNNPENGAFSITIEGDKIIWSDGSYTVITEINDDYITLTDYKTDGTQEGTHRLYQDEAKARAYYDSLSSDPLENGFTTTYLNGKTLYFVQYDDFGYDGVDEAGMQWNMARMDFTDSTIAWTEYDTPDTETHTFTYTITSDGEVLVDGHTIELVEQTDDYLRVCEEGDCNTYLFFDESAAQAFKDQQNQTASSLDSLIVGKTVYQHCADSNSDWIDALTFGTDGTLTIGNFSTTYSIEGDVITTVDPEDNSTEVHTLQSYSEEYIKFLETSGWITTFYYTEALAAAAPAEDCGVENTPDTAYYMLQEGDIAAHAILVGDPSKDKEYAADHTFTSLEENVDERDGGTWSIEDGKLKHVWSNGSVEIHSFAAQPAVGVTITNETYGVSGPITGYYSID